MTESKTLLGQLGGFLGLSVLLLALLFEFLRLFLCFLFPLFLGYQLFLLPLLFFSLLSPVLFLCLLYVLLFISETLSSLLFRLFILILTIYPSFYRTSRRR